MSLLMRRAAPEEAAELGALVREAGAPPMTEQYVAEQPVFAAWEGKQLAGFFALAERDGQWWLDHLWVAEGCTGRGRGRWLFTEAVRRARRLDAETLHFRPLPSSAAFFRRLGARPAAAPGELQVVVATWEEPLPDSVSELGSTE